MVSQQYTVMDLFVSLKSVSGDIVCLPIFCWQKVRSADREQHLNICLNVFNVAEA